MSDTEAPAFLAPRAAVWFGAVLLAGLLGVVAFSLADHPKASAIETFSQTTAVGDTAYYEVPAAPLAVPEPVLNWQGRAWTPANYEKVKIDDPDMQRVGKDEQTGLTIYQPHKKDPAGHFIKIDVGEYLRIDPR